MMPWSIFNRQEQLDAAEDKLGLRGSGDDGGIKTDVSCKPEFALCAATDEQIKNIFEKQFDNGSIQPYIMERMEGMMYAGQTSYELNQKMDQVMDKPADFNLRAEKAGLSDEIQIGEEMVRNKGQVFTPLQ